ncbi:gelsolin-like protein 2 [Aplysia californica]|uniref:Gelsolin-like protein 2 n=1 Tax=Aplysia californica TaxID=6500 RepID=A0ABM1A1X8_APLCA|nr:gelsolin-like protein 2 [Aplysia californica]
MSGLTKAKQYDWKDSNLALFGSDLERQVKKESAQTEPAWKNAGQKVGLQIWRIVKFKVVSWPKEDYGKFYNGDSYIVLNTYKEEGSDALLYDVHFWIGKYSSQDEYGTAAYKTVELDTFLDDVPIQHREVQGYESSLFRSYFKTIELLEGGAESGFRQVKPEEYVPRLLHFHGDRSGVTVKQVPRVLDSLDGTDVYILDLGLRLIQWNGSGSNKDERFKAVRYMQNVASERSGKAKTEVVEEGQDTEEFESFLNESGKTEESSYDAADRTKELYRLSDSSGKMSFSLEKKGKMAKTDLDSNDVFILDTKLEVFVWIGKKTSHNEKKNAMAYAHKYLQESDHPLVSVSCLPEGRVVKAFESALAA